ncbi:MAG: hypothetical protein JOY60_09890 [Burkholderiaceae bacterium]|nr:hypothetical protein [Roseateles sp.]MBV8470154.1 hypothetical protein [Burkholderiaceae bacterium]
MSTLRSFIAAVLLTALLSACAHLVGPQSVQVSAHELQAKLDQVLPLERPVLEVFTLKVESPRLRLLPETQQLALSVHLNLHDRLLGHDKGGDFAFRAGLQFDAPTLSLKLVHVQVDQFQIDGVAPQMQAHINRLAAPQLEQRFEGFVLRQFKPEELGTAYKLGYTVGRIEVRSDGLKIELVPQS